MSLWTTGDSITAAKLNKSFNTGLDASKGTPTVAGEAYLATDTNKLYISYDGSTWSNSYIPGGAGGLAQLDANLRVSSTNTFIPGVSTPTRQLSQDYQNGSRTRLLFITAHSPSNQTNLIVQQSATPPAYNGAFAIVSSFAVNNKFPAMAVVPPNYYYCVVLYTGTVDMWREVDL